MTRKASRPSCNKKEALQVVHPHAAAIDIGLRFHVVAIPPNHDEMPVRTFNTFTGDLCRLADWLDDKKVTTIAMESTGVYWIPVYELLEERGFDVILVNARDAKNVPGRKTDINEFRGPLHPIRLMQEIPPALAEEKLKSLPGIS